MRSQRRKDALSATDVMKLLGASYERTRWAMRVLEDRGLLKRVARGKYVVNSGGRKVKAHGRRDYTGRD